jgi:hypothetical protein
VVQTVPGVLGSQNPWYSAREGGEGYNVEAKVKIYPVTGNKDPEEGDRYNSILSLMLALEGVGGQRHAPILFPRNELVLIWKWGIALGLQCRSGSLRKNCHEPGIYARTFHCVAFRYTHYVIPTLL